ncbi:MAG: class III cytochrome C family protein [Candidatus Eisenbacteria bacterium]
MKSRTAALWSAAVGLTFALAAPHAALAPGPQSEGHAKIEARCFDCHTPGQGTPRAKCIACHALDRIGADDATRDPRAQAIIGMHRSLGDRPCGACHTDHAGRSPARATRVFTHDALPASSRNACRDCHASQRPADALHRDAAAACGACHATTAWKPATFAHEKYFVLDRDHATSCRTCHEEAADFKRYTCYGCHEHSPARIRAEHDEEGIRGSRLDDCVRCHRSADEHEGREGGRRRRGRDRGGDD